MTRSSILSLTLVFALLSCGGEDSAPKATSEPVVGIPAPAAISYNVVNIYPHDTSAFIQGLVYHQGQLYESTGLTERSRLRRVELKSGAIQKEIRLSDSLFGEGITILNDTLYQLTWQNNKIFAYTLNDLKRIRTYPWTTEGWGITNDGRDLIISNGTDKLYYVRPPDLRPVKVVSVQDQLGPVNQLNELEYINGFIYANRWGYDYIVKIDPASGQVKGKLDLDQLLQKYANIPLTTQEVEETGAYLNGIAWDSTGKRLFVTGKRWPKLFELKGEF